MERVAFSPGEFAALFGKSQTWGYRQIYNQKVKAITQHGRILIPAKEVERILDEAGLYSGLKSKAPKSKEEIQTLAPKLTSAWQLFLKNRRKKANAVKRGINSNGGKAGDRNGVLQRLTRGKKKKKNAEG